VSNTSILLCVDELAVGLFIISPGKKEEKEKREKGKRERK